MIAIGDNLITVARSKRYTAKQFRDLFLYAIEPEKYAFLLDFSTPKTEEEAFVPEEIPAEPEKPRKVYGDPDPVQPVLEQRISIDDFKKTDLRVCKIVKAQEIRKSANCLKLTLSDGIGERNSPVFHTTSAILMSASPGMPTCRRGSLSHA